MKVVVAVYVILLVCARTLADVLETCCTDNGILQALLRWLMGSDFNDCNSCLGASRIVLFGQ